MYNNVLFMSWGSANPGREHTAAEHFGEFLGYLQGLQANGTIATWQPVFLNAHGGTTSGFIVITGDQDKLSGLANSEQWFTHVTRGLVNMQNFSVVSGGTGEDTLNRRMATWLQAVGS